MAKFKEKQRKLVGMSVTLLLHSTRLVLNCTITWCVRVSYDRSACSIAKFVPKMDRISQHRGVTPPINYLVLTKMLISGCNSG
jgi:hypothetical protein